MSENTVGTSILKAFKDNFDRHSKYHEMTMLEYLELCKTDKMAYASPAERMLAAIGEPVVIDTKLDSRLSRIHSNKTIKIYPAFKEFYGMESTIEQIVSFFTHSAQGLEESKQICYLLGPVGSAKSSLAEKLKELMEDVPVYVLKGSPVFESPLTLFYPKEKFVDELAAFNIPQTAIRTIPSPWALKRLEEYGGDITQFKVVKLYPSRVKQECITRIEPGDENNQDISSLVGKIDIRKLNEDYSQNDPDAYSYSGGLNRGNNGLVEMVEMFKTPIKMLHPLLTATQDKHYKGTEAISSIPFDGIILAHSNESEWQQFKSNKTNEAFIDRVNLITVPYCLRVTEEVDIYKKLLRHSQLSSAPCAPGTLELLAQFCVLSRLKEPKNSTLFSKMRVYDGENIKDVDPKAKPLQEYKDDAGVTEGMEGMSTRFAFKVLSKVFNYDSEEIAASAIHLMYILETEIMKEQFDEGKQQALLSFLKGTLQSKYLEFLEKDIRASFLESFSGLCQNRFETYCYYADAWVSETDYRDENTGTMLDREVLNNELEKIEKPGGIVNSKDWRHELVNYILRYKANHNGAMPRWDAFEKMRLVIEKNVLASTDDILPVISFTPKKTDEDKKKHADFVEKMKARGYTERQTRLVCEWFMRARRSN